MLHTITAPCATQLPSSKQMTSKFEFRLFYRFGFYVVRACVRAYVFAHATMRIYGFILDALHSTILHIVHYFMPCHTIPYHLSNYIYPSISLVLSIYYLYICCRTQQCRALYITESRFYFCFVLFFNERFSGRHRLCPMRYSMVFICVLPLLHYCIDIYTQCVRNEWRKNNTHTKKDRWENCNSDIGVTQKQNGTIEIHMLDSILQVKSTTQTIYLSFTQPAPPPPPPSLRRKTTIHRKI